VLLGGDKVGEARAGEDFAAEAVSVAVRGRVQVEQDEANFALALLEQRRVAGAGKGRMRAAVLVFKFGDEAVDGAGGVVVLVGGKWK